MSSIWTIRRSATDAKLTGLCGGVARYWGIDPVLVRVGAVLLALSGGIGVVLYLAGWLLIPTDHRQTSIVHDLAGPSVRKWPKEAWVVIVAVVCLLVFAAFGFASPFGFGPAIVLALIWYFGYYKNREPKGSRNAASGSPPPPAPPLAPAPPAAPAPHRYPGPATPFTQAAEAWQQRVAEVSGRPPTPTAPVVPPVQPAPSAQTYPSYADATVTTDPRLADPVGAEHAAFLATPDPVGLYAEPARTAAVAPSRAALARTHSARRLRLIGLVVLGLTLTGLGVADALGVPVSAVVYVAAALLVVGLTLVAATWFGRARGILPVGLALLLALVSIMVADLPRANGEWSRTVSHAALPATCDEQDVGLLTVDLSTLRLPTSGRHCAHVDAGQLEVVVPRDVNVVINYTIDAGVVIENGESIRSGTDLVDTIRLPARDPNRPTLTLDLSLDVGDLVVQR